MNTDFVFAVLRHTPLWAWLLLAALIALGLSQCREHVVSRPRVVLLPSVLGAASLWSAAGSFGANAPVIGAWAVGAAAAVALNRWTRLPREVLALPGHRFRIGGSAWPLALLVGVFAVRYAIAVTIAVRPALAGDATFALAASATYGAVAGFFAARAARVLRQPVIAA